MNRTRKRLGLGIAGGLIIALAPFAAASAHHTDVTCTDRATSTWTIKNSEADKTMTFTTNHGITGSIGKGGSTTVTWNGTELTVYGTWSNGVTATNAGQGNCVPPVVTTTSTIPETTTTIPETTTTIAETTTTIEETTTTVPEVTTTAPATTVAETTTTAVDVTTPPTYPPETPPATIPPTTPPPPHPNDCLLHPGGVYDGTYAPNWIAADPETAEGTTYWQGLPCSRPHDPPPAPTTTVPAPTPEGHLPDTGNTGTGTLAEIAGIVALLGAFMLGTTWWFKRTDPADLEAWENEDA